ncbi:MAG: hypothetical protein ACP5RI_01830, partial [Candidatus Micrarchaeia archaeon]
DKVILSLATMMRVAFTQEQISDDIFYERMAKLFNEEGINIKPIELKNLFIKADDDPIKIVLEIKATFKILDEISNELSEKRFNEILTKNIDGATNIFVYAGMAHAPVFNNV